MARALYVSEPFALDLDATVYAFDATTIDLCLSVFAWAPFRSTKAAIKLHTLLALRGSNTFPRSARHAAQAQALLAEVAEEDFARVGNPPAIRALQGLSRARQANVLRHWLRQAHATAPSAAQQDQLLSQVEACTTRGHALHLKVGAAYVRREGGVLVFAQA